MTIYKRGYPISESYSVKVDDSICITLKDLVRLSEEEKDRLIHTIKEGLFSGGIYIFPPEISQIDIFQN